METICPVCQGPLRQIAPRTDKYSYYSCSNCGLVMGLPIPSPEEIAAFYDGFLFLKPTEREFEARVKAILEDVSRIVQDIKEKAGLTGRLRLLDWGGGTGFHANAFAHFGFDVTMIDIDRQACEYARERFGGRFQVINADPIRHPFDQTFDVIFCNQVIEHHVAPRRLLDAIRQRVAPGGVVILTTPNQGSREFCFRWWLLSAYLGRVSGKSRRKKLAALLKFLKTPWMYCDPPRHLYAFNRHNLTLLLQRCNFTVVTCFIEHGTFRYYSPRDRIDWEVRRPLSLARIVADLCSHVGLAVLRACDTQNRWGDNLVVYARPT